MIPCLFPWFDDSLLFGIVSIFIIHLGLIFCDLPGLYGIRSFLIIKYISGPGPDSPIKGSGPILWNRLLATFSMGIIDEEYFLRILKLNGDRTCFISTRLPF